MKKIEINNLSFKYSKNKKQENLLQGISMFVNKGEWVSILGPNGSGKSTLAKIMANILKFKEGDIKIDGLDINLFKRKDFAQTVAYIPQIFEAPNGVLVYDFVALGRNPYLNFLGKLSNLDRKKVEELMKETDIWKWKEKTLDELSGGERQKVLIAMILAQDTDIILLDEPTTFLDIRNQHELLAMMSKEHKKGKTIVTILHDINQSVQYSDRIYIMKKGKMHSSGIPSDVINSHTLKEVFGVNAKLHQDGSRKYVTDVKLIDCNVHIEQEHKFKKEMWIALDENKKNIT